MNASIPWVQSAWTPAYAYLKYLPSNGRNPERAAKEMHHGDDVRHMEHVDALGDNARVYNALEAQGADVSCLIDGVQKQPCSIWAGAQEDVPQHLCTDMLPYVLHNSTLRALYYSTDGSFSEGTRLELVFTSDCVLTYSLAGQTPASAHYEYTRAISARYADLYIDFANGAREHVRLNASVKHGGTLTSSRGMGEFALLM